MIERLLAYYEKCHYKKQSLVLKLTHDKVFDWRLGIAHRDSDTEIFSGSGASLNLLCAKAYVALEGWASEFDDLEEIEMNM